MIRRIPVTPAFAAGIIIFCGYWAWALFASPDVLLVLNRRIALPLLGTDIPAGLFLVMTPLAGLALFLATRPRGRRAVIPAVALPMASLFNAVRCLKLHDPGLSYLTAGMAVMATALAAWTWLASGPFCGRPVSGRNVLAVIGLATGAVIEGALLFLLVPWALRGDLPGNLNSYPFGPAVRRIVFADLAGLDLRSGPIRKSLRGVRLEGADLNRAKLGAVDLRDASLFRARINWADLEGADLKGAVLSEAQLSFSDLSRADLSGAELSGIYALGTDIRGARLRGVRDHVLRIIYADCRGADFGSAKLNASSFFGSDCRSAVFRDADLTAVSLTRTRLDEADLSGAILNRASLGEASLKGAVLDGADLGGAIDLLPEALAEARSLRGAKLDPALLGNLKRRHPFLF